MNSKYTEEFKIKIVNEYLKEDLGCRAIAKKYSLPSKNYVLRWKEELIKKGLIADISKPLNHKGGKTNIASKGKTAYEKQLERENIELKAKLAYFKELEKLIVEDSKKK